MAEIVCGEWIAWNTGLDTVNGGGCDGAPCRAVLIR